MKKLFLAVFVFWIGIFNTEAIELELYSKNAILYQLDENTILYEKNSNEVISIASMTKIMTAIVAIEQIENLDDTITFTKADFIGLEEANASVAGFKIGQTVTYQDLLYGLLLPSGADAAQALTRTTYKTKELFVAKMNEKAQDLGLKNTHFMNETGLDEEGHYSTVFEVAEILKYALKNETLKKILASSSYTLSDQSLTLYSTIDKNKRRYGLSFDYLEGGKTGSTYDAGLCLASFSSFDHIHYILVTARAPYNEGPKHLYDAKTIYEYFMTNYGNKIIVEKSDTLITLNTLYTKEDSVSFYAKKDIQKYLSNDFDKQELEYQYEGVKVLTSKINPGTKLGTLKVLYQKELLYQTDIVLENKLSFSLLKYLIAHIESIICATIILIVILYFVFKKRKDRK